MSIIRTLQAITISELAYTSKQSLEEIFFPCIKPYKESYLKVSELHNIWYAEYGNPSGTPAIVVHGGPGAGAGDNDMRFFDPKIYRIILFDQRGAKRSEPFGEVLDNTTPNLISDMEKLRKHLAIEKWLVFGGSWGSALSMLYGQAHSDHCLGFVLRGIFLGTKAEYEQVWYGMKDIFPELWDELEKFLPESERSDLIKSYYTRFMSADPKIHMPAARCFVKYDLTSSFLMHNQGVLQKTLSDDRLVLGLSRLFSHYCMNEFFVTPNQIIDNIKWINHLPAIMVHGRYDVVCRASSAYRLHKVWPNSELVFVQDAGHASVEPGTAKALVEATNKMAQVVTSMCNESFT